MKNKEQILKLTEFEKKVYAVCRLIPFGETRSYAWIAKRIGHPKACRAVGNALHKNPFAPAVPCHRVIRSNGRIGGFAAGITKKKRLLKQEKLQA